MRLAILGHPEGRFSQQLLAAARSANVSQVGLYEFSELRSAVSDRVWTCTAADGAELTEFDSVIVRTMPLGSLEQIIFRVDLLHRLQSAGVTVVNSPRCLEVAIDKYLTLGRLQQAGLPVPQTRVAQNLTDALHGFYELGGDVVVKPLFGGEGRGLMRVEQEDLAERVFKTLLTLGNVIYLQRFIPHQGFDIRVLWLGDRHWTIRRRSESDWRTNVSRGAKAERCELPPAWLDLTRQAASAVEGWFVGVDLLPDLNGDPWMLEVNAVPGWDGVAAAYETDVAAEVIAMLAAQIGR